MCREFIIIGISDSATPYFPPKVTDLIGSGQVFSGGKRHHEIVAPLLPEGAQWIDITVPLDAVFAQYEDCFARSGGQGIIVFASGDPLFFGFANTIQRKMPDARIMLFPYFNSLQMLSHRLVLPYHDMKVVSLTGRPWHELDVALIRHHHIIGVLTDGEHTPASIAQRMMDYGYTEYQMHVGEHIGSERQERITTLSLEEAARGEFGRPNCLILTVRSSAPAAHPSFGIPDGEFELLDGREKMITKAPIRLLTLSALGLQDKHSFWDIGFCTGSISIEAKLLFPHLHITAFEIREEGRRLMEVNARRFRAPGITAIIGDFLATDCNSTTAPPPDAIFIGGHGGRLDEMVRKASQHLIRDGTLVYNCVSPSSVTDHRIRADSRERFIQTAQACGLQIKPTMHVAINNYHPIDILKAIKK